MVSQELLVELKDIIREDYGVELPMQEVSFIGNSLVGFFETLSRIEFGNEYENENSRDSNN